MTTEDIIELSEKLLLAVKMEDSTEHFLDQLKGLNILDIKNNLTSDNKKKAFWINIYNSFYQILRKDLGVKKPQIFNKRLIDIADKKWSLDDVEHGILRKYRFKYSLGYWPQLFPSTVIKELALSQIDYRIHFALNCGAKSCPPIAFYSVDKIDEQLEQSTLSFLESETKIDSDKHQIHVTKLFLWFLADFGGMKGVRNILEDKIKISTKGNKIVFQPYSWDEDLGNFG